MQGQAEEDIEVILFIAQLTLTFLPCVNILAVAYTSCVLVHVG